MDPIGGVGSIIELTTLSKDIIQTCRKYAEAFRDAPIVFSRFCDELEALNVILDHFLTLQYTRENATPYQSNVLTEILRRTHLLRDYEHQLRKLQVKIKKVELQNFQRRILFPFQEKQILDGLNVVQRLRSILESALLLDYNSYTLSIHTEVQKISAALKINHNQMLNQSLRTESKLRERTAIVRDGFSHTCSIPKFVVTKMSPMKGTRSRTQSRPASYRAMTKKIIHLSFGRLSFSNENFAEFSKTHRFGRRPRRSHVKMFFVPSPTFWQTTILLRLDWATHLDSLIVPMFSLQFLDVVEDNHPIINASIRGDLHALEDIFMSQKGSPLCSITSGWTPLHFASAYGKIDACRFLIAHGAPLGATGFRGITPIHLAAHFGHFGVFRVLLEAGSDPDEYHEHGMNAIFEILSNEKASKSPDLVSLLKWLLHGQDQFLLDAQARDNSQRSILFHLVYSPAWTIRPTWNLTIDEGETIKLVLHEGVRGDELDIYQLSVLHEACRDGRLDLVEMLFLGDCNINSIDGKGYTPLHYAVESENLELVSMLVRHGADINAVARDDQYSCFYFCGYPTPLQLAAEVNSVEIVDFLIQHGAGHYDENVSKAFRVAVAVSSLETAQYFIENAIRQLDLRHIIRDTGPDLAMIEIVCKAGAPLENDVDVDDYDDANGWSRLATVARHGYSDATKKLIELGANVNKITRGLTPLGYAAREGHGNIVDILLAAGAQTDLTGSQMLTPWQLAASRGYDGIAKNIARHVDASSIHGLVHTLPKDIAEHQIHTKEGPLRLELDLRTAVFRGDLEVIDRLIEKGCDLTGGENLRSPLDIAINLGNFAVAERLVKAGADLNVDISFMDAVRHENAAFIELMIQHGADANNSDFRGSTPLLLSLDLYWSKVIDCKKQPHDITQPRCVTQACYINGEVIRVLLSAGANPNAIDNFGRTPLGKAAAIGNFEAVVALVKAGADLNRPSSQNTEECIELCELVYRTPLAWAALMGHKNVVKFLFDSGAEWRFLPKEPALSYTHCLLMESWFPDDAEARVDSMPCNELLSVPPGDFIVESDAADDLKEKCRSRSFGNDNKEKKSTPTTIVKACGYDAIIRYYETRNLYTTTMTLIRYVTFRAQRIYDRLQSLRIQVLAFSCISLLLLARESLRFASIPSLANVRLAILAMLIGVLMVTWINHPTI